MLYAQIDKNELLKSTAGPRIIFVGGSNLAYGLDSKRIKDSLHLNPINTGVHINIGLKYMLANTLPYVKAGDIIVLAAEYQQFYGNVANGDMELFSLVTDVVPQTKNLLDHQQYLKLIQLVPAFAQTKLRPIFLFYKFPQDTSVGVYDRKAFNVYGDAYVHWKSPGENPKPYPALSEKFNGNALQAVISFQKAVQQKKAKLLVTFPGYQYSSYKVSVAAVKNIQQQLKDQGFRLISTPEEFIMPDSLMFDTPYHLTRKGVDYRTGLLINDLKKALQP